MEKRIVLITGGNRGIGFEIARQLAAAGLTAIISAMKPEAGRTAVEELRRQGLKVDSVTLDVTDPDTIRQAVTEIETRHGRLDILINNAGINSSKEAVGKPSVTDLEVARKIFETNFFGTVAVTQAMLPLLRRSRAARILNQTSDLGSLGRQSDDCWLHAKVKPLGYAASKAALNMFTIQLAAELRDENIAVISTNPGSTATDLNAHRGLQTVEEGAAVPVRFALADSVPSGAFVGSTGREPW